MAAQHYITKYNALNGKTVGQSAIGKVLFPLQKDIESGIINKADSHAKHIAKIQSNLVKAFNAAVDGTIKLDIVLITSAPKAKNKKQKLNTAHPQKPKTPKPQLQLFNGLSGFTMANEQPKDMPETFELPTEVGKWLGKRQRFELVISLDGETHSGKSELAKQIANALAEAGYNGAWFDLEQGGMSSIDTKESFERNVSAKNMERIAVLPEAENGIETIREWAAHPQVDWIAIDSATKLSINNNSWFEELRKEFPKTIFIPIWQQNAKGGTRGGSGVQFDAPVHIKVYRPDHTTYEKNYAEFLKNRGNATDQHYLIAKKQITNINQNENV